MEGGVRVNDDGKPHNDNTRHDAHTDDLAEQLSLLQAVDRRITPGHVARRFREMQRALRDETRASSQPGTLAAERDYALEAAVPDIEQPTQRAQLALVSVTESFCSGDPAGIEQPARLAELTIALEPLRSWELADIEQPSHLAEWVISVEPLPSWNEL
jgi:hypothetical protein